MAAPRLSDATMRRAMEFVRQYEAAGKPVRKVVVDGQRVEIEFDGPAQPETPEAVQW